MNDYAGARILVVDDNAQNRMLVEGALEDEGYDIVLAASGEEALRDFERAPAQCVLLDVRMPGMDGFEVCRRLREHPEGADTPVLFLTALRDVDSFDQAIAVGGDDFLTKPLRPAELVVRVRAALELRRLSAENRGCIATIREQRDAVMRLQLQKEQLTAFLVHDLKNPVSALDLHAQLLLRDRTLSERSTQSARMIRQEARRLTQLITNMLDINKGNAGQLPVNETAFDPRPLVEAVAAEFAVRADEVGVRLASEMQVDEIQADPDLLRRVLENLLDNAIRHAPSGSTVLLSGARAEHDVVLQVRDQGPGVPEPLRSAVFEQFVCGESGARRGGGYGLGLAFCRLAVQAQGGTIWVEDGAPGAAFCVRLPGGPRG